MTSQLRSASYKSESCLSSSSRQAVRLSVSAFHVSVDDGLLQASAVRAARSTVEYAEAQRLHSKGSCLVVS